MDINLRQEYSKLRDCIDENHRASQQTGFEFIDPGMETERVTNRKCQVIFGRRGTGKTTLLKSINQENGCDYSININIEDIKDLHYPDILVQVLIIFFRSLLTFVNKERKYKFKTIRDRYLLKKKISRVLNDLKDQLQVPEEFEQEERNLVSEGEKANLGSKLGSKLSGISLGISSETNIVREVQRRIKYKKIEILKNKLPEYKTLIQEINEYLGNKGVFLIFDDFYFLPNWDQPFFIDYFHRLSKSNRLHLKIATIPYRTKLYVVTTKSIFGIELHQDAQVINLDYTLDRFSSVLTFMEELLLQAIEKSGAQISIDEMISQEGFKHLCLASGGIPREFLSLFESLLQRKLINQNLKIHKSDIIPTAKNNINDKTDQIRNQIVDSSEILEDILSFLRKTILGENQTNVFLISIENGEDVKNLREYFRQLNDLRCIHLIAKDIARDFYGDNKRYVAYLIDYCFLSFPLPVNFKLVDNFREDNNKINQTVRSSSIVPWNDIKDIHNKFISKKRGV